MINGACFQAVITLWRWMPGCRWSTPSQRRSQVSIQRWSFGLFMQMYLTWVDLTPDQGFPPSIQSHSPLCTTAQVTDRYCLLGRRKLPLTHWFSLEIHVRVTERRAQTRPRPLSNIWIIEALTRTWGQPQVKQSRVQYFFKNSTTAQILLGEWEDAGQWVSYQNDLGFYCSYWVPLPPPPSARCPIR